MTIADAIEKIDSVKPHQYSEDTLIGWLSDIDGIIFEEIMKGRNGAPDSFTAYGDDRNKELLVPEPYTNLYILYMAAQIDYFNAEYDRFNNSMMMFNTVYNTFADWYNRNHTKNNPKRITI